jgi:hypothetical protein
MSKDGAGAVAWDKKSYLHEYKYVRFTGSNEDGERFGDDVRILGKKIDESNCGDVMGDGGSVKFDLESNTLTLTDAQLDLKNFHHEYDESNDPDSGCNYVAGITADRTINLVLNGRNRIYSTAEQYAAKRQYVFGMKIGAMKDVSVTGTGSLDISFAKNSDALKYYGIEIGNNMTISNSRISVDLGGTAQGTGFDAGFDAVALKDGAKLTVKTTGEGSTGMYYVMASDMSMDESSMLELISDGKAFNCVMLSDEVKALGALVNDAATSQGAAAWDKSALLSKFKYVRFPENYNHTHQITHVDGKAATCTEDGYEEYWVCDECGVMFSDASGADDKIIEAPIVIPASGSHTWDKGKVTKKATPLRKGEKTYTCTVCGVTRTETFTFKEAKKEKIDKIKEWIRKIFGSDEIPDGASADILTVKLSQTDFKYDGTVQKPDVLYVFAGDYEIVPGDYKVEYSDDKSCNAGSYLVTVTALDAEGISVYGTAEYTIAKAANTVTVKERTAKVNYKDLKWKSQTLLSDTVLTVSDPAGKVTYTKLSGNKKITIESKTGNVKVKKGLKKGTYIVKVKVKAAGDENHRAAGKTVTIRIIVK